MRRLCPKCLHEFDDTHDRCPHDSHPLLQIGDQDRAGEVFDERFTLLGKLGSGGMGTVHRALQHSTEREVAIKLLAPQLTRDATGVKRFLREARSASRLAHPNIITVFDFGQSTSGELYIVMELVGGQTLAEVMASGPMATDRTVAIASQIMDALQAAHDAQVVHRDLKPANVMILQGAGHLGEFVKVVDFGIAKVHSIEASTLTHSGMICGTPAYMSPEQARGEPVDGRTDLYAAGVVLYEMLGGARPFSGVTPVELMMAHAHEQPRDLRQIAPHGLPDWLASTVMAALSKDPSRRPRSAREFKARLYGPTPDEAAAEAEETLDAAPGWRAPHPEVVAPVPMPTPAPHAPVSEAIEPPTRSRAPLLVIGLAALAIAVGLATTWKSEPPVTTPPAEDTSGARAELRGPSDPKPPEPKPAPPDAVPEVDAQSAAPTPSQPAARRKRPRRAKLAEARAAQRRAPAVSAAGRVASTMIRVDTEPAGSVVFLDGVKQGASPVELTRPSEGESLRVSARRSGFAPSSQRVAHASPERILLTLVKKRPAKPQPPRPEPPVGSATGTEEPVLAR